MSQCLDTNFMDQKCLIYSILVVVSLYCFKLEFLLAKVLPEHIDVDNVESTL